MFVDASAIVALLSDESESPRISAALAMARQAITSPVALLEAALALARPDKLNRPLAQIEPFIHQFLDERGIALCDLPPAADTARLALDAAHRFRQGRRGLNICDCLHYACAKHEAVPILATDDEFCQTDLETIP